MALEFLTNFINAYPKISIIVIALVATFVSMLITKFFIHQERMKELKEKQKACQKMLKDVRDKEKLAEIQKDMVGCSMEMMKMSFKPMFISFIPFILLFIFLRKVYAGTGIASSWFWYYIGASLVSSFIYKKLLRLA